MPLGWLLPTTRLRPPSFPLPCPRPKPLQLLKRFKFTRRPTLGQLDRRSVDTPSRTVVRNPLTLPTPSGASYASTLVANPGNHRDTLRLDARSTLHRDTLGRASEARQAAQTTEALVLRFATNPGCEAGAVPHHSRSNRDAADCPASCRGAEENRYAVKDGTEGAVLGVAALPRQFLPRCVASIRVGRVGGGDLARGARWAGVECRQAAGPDGGRRRRSASRNRSQHTRNLRGAYVDVDPENELARAPGLGAPVVPMKPSVLRV